MLPSCSGTLRFGFHGNERQTDNHPDKNNTALLKRTTHWYYIIICTATEPNVLCISTLCVYKFCGKIVRFWMCKTNCTYSKHCDLSCLYSPVPSMIKSKCEQTLQHRIHRLTQRTVQHNFNPSRGHTKVTDVKKGKRRRTGTLLQGVSKQVLSFAGKEWTLILLHRTNLLQNKYTNELINK